VSDLPELIHAYAQRAVEVGVRSERERIIKLLERWGEEAGCYCCASDAAAADIISEIKGEKADWLA
jgi:hypothetical protein